MGNSNQHILIVEDNTDLCDMLSAYFRVQGYEVSTAAWGEDGVRMASEKPPHLVLLDIRLPDFDGYEVCRQLRRLHSTRFIPIIFLTEKRDREDKLTGLELGAVDYITKPFDMKELHLRVRNTLRRASLTNLNNSITGLPEGDLVQEKLREMLKLSDWGLVVAGLSGINRFRDKFGFVAADDVMRAVSLMLNNALDESGATGDFLGHNDAGTFLIITNSQRTNRIADNCRNRLKAAVPYFYPAGFNLSSNNNSDHPLTIHIRILTSQETQAKDLLALQTALSQ